MPFQSKTNIRSGNSTSLSSGSQGFPLNNTKNSSPTLYGKKYASILSLSEVAAIALPLRNSLKCAYECSGP